MNKTRRVWICVILGAAIFIAGQIIALKLPGVGDASAKAKTGNNYAVTVALKPNDKQGMLNRVYDTADPTSAAFRQYYSPKQVASHYGRSKTDINKFKNYFKKYHVSVSAYSGNLFLRVHGTYKNMKKAFKAKVKGKYTVYKLPKNLKSQTASVIGLVGSKKLLNISQSLPFKKRKLHHQLETSNKQPQTNISHPTFSKKYGADKFADQYHLSKLYEQGLSAKGQHIAILAGSDFYLKDVQKYLKQNGLPTDVSRIHKIYVGSKYNSRKTMFMDPGFQGEATLDVDQTASLAPDADIDVYIYPEIDSQMTGDASFLHQLMEATGDNLAQQISISMAYGDELTGLGDGMSETTKQYEAAMNLIMQQSALQGQTIFNASGDNGAYMQPNAKPNMDTMVSPYLVSVGGTTLPMETIEGGKVVKISEERAWGNIYNTQSPIQQLLPFPIPFIPDEFAGGGGGFAKYNPTPRFQRGVSGVNTFTAIQHLRFEKARKKRLNLFGTHVTIPLPAQFKLVGNPRIIHGTGNSRNLPDIAGNADNETGYALYMTGAHTKKEKGKGAWDIGGGTSFTAPQMAAANAVMNSGLGASTGFWNPQIYKFAQETDSPFTPLDSMNNNDNLYYAGTPGKLYNQATGLGTVNFEKLFDKFNVK